MALGDLGYWPPDSGFCIFFGPTPASTGDEIRPASAVNVFGCVTGDPTAFRKVRAGARVRLERADAVILTGGIGPTQDDLTREGLSAATGRDLVFDEGYAAHLQEWWARRGDVMPESNLRQAHYPAGAELLDNPRGTAPGLALSHNGKLIFCIPGVPAEMEGLLHNEVIPRIISVSQREQAIVSRVIRTWGRSESDVAQMLDDLYHSANPSIAFLATSAEIKVRVTAKGDTVSRANALIEPVEHERPGEEPVLERLDEALLPRHHRLVAELAPRLRDVNRAFLRQHP